jgi:hypothetical protein
MSPYSATAVSRFTASIRTATAAMLALAVALSTTPIVRAADERPDLQLELIGLPLARATRDVQVRVTNVSVWWATGSKLNMETVSPTAGNVKQFDVGNLDPGQSVTLRYTLAADCNGDVVKANVTPARNYAGVAETQLNNNQVQREACTAQTATNPAIPPTARTSDAVALKPAASSAAVNPKPVDVAAAVTTPALNPAASHATDGVQSKPVDVPGAVIKPNVNPGAAVPGVGLPSQRSSTTTGKVDTGPRLGAGGSLATVYYPPNEQLEEFYVDYQGAINVVWKAQGGRWRPAVALTAPGFAPPGAPLAAVYQELNEQLEVFTVGVDGAVRGIYKAHNGPWQPPFTLTDAGLALPGAHLAASSYPLNNQLEVFVVDRGGRLVVISKAENGAWKPAGGLREGFAAPGAPLAVVYQSPYAQLEVFAVAGDGSVHGLWRAQNSYWSEQFSLAPAGFAPPSANVAAIFYPSDNHLEVFVVDGSGTLNVIWKAQNGAWQAPADLQANFAAPGAPLAVAYQPLYELHVQLEVFAVTNNGSVHGLWKLNNSKWQPQFSLGSDGFGFAKAPITATFYPAQKELAVITTDSATSSKLAWKLNNGAWATCAAPLELGTGTNVCDRGPTVAASRAAACTNLFREFARGGAILKDSQFKACEVSMGLEKACDDANGTLSPTTDTRYTGDTDYHVRQALICVPKYSDDSFGDQLTHLVRGIGEGLSDALVASAPFFSMAIQAYACADGAVFACATLALDIANMADLHIPGVADKVLDIARQTPGCASGDIVACAQLGAQGANAAGLSISGLDVGQVVADARQCADGEFAACMRLGKAAADATGTPSADLLGNVFQAEACADGNLSACTALGRLVTQAGVPLDEITDGFTNAHACLGNNNDACFKLGSSIAAAHGVRGFAIAGTADTIESCLAGVAAACTDLGGTVARASGVPLGGVQDGVENVRQCANGNADACTALGRGVAIATGV